MVWVRSHRMLDLDRPAGSPRVKPRQLRLDAIDRLDDVGARLLEDDAGRRRACRSAHAAFLASSGPATAVPMSLTRIGAPLR